MDALRQLLPAPEITLTLNDGIIDASGLKTISGFMLWVPPNPRLRAYRVAALPQASPSVWLYGRMHSIARVLPSRSYPSCIA
jgi:hypothetical protein